MKNIFEKAMHVIHEKTLNVLETVGLKVMFEGYYPSIEAYGAKVDRTNKIVFFPSSLVEKIGASKFHRLVYRSTCKINKEWASNRNKDV